MLLLSFTKPKAFESYLEINEPKLPRFYNRYYVTELSIFRIHEKNHSITPFETAMLQTGVT